MVRFSGQPEGRALRWIGCGESNPPSGSRRVNRSSNTVGCPSSKSRSVTTGSTLPVVIAALRGSSPEAKWRSRRLDTASPAAFRSRGGPHAAVDPPLALAAAQTVDLTTWILTRPLLGVKRAHGFKKLTAMPTIVAVADCAGRALAGLLAPCTHGHVHAHAPSTVGPAMLSVASTRTCPLCTTGPKSSAIITAPGEKCGLGGPGGRGCCRWRCRRAAGRC